MALSEEREEREEEYQSWWVGKMEGLELGWTWTMKVLAALLTLLLLLLLSEEEEEEEGKLEKESEIMRR